LYPLDPNSRPSDGVALEIKAAIEKELGWVYTYHKSSKIPKLLKGFFESGIISKLNYFDQYTSVLLRRKGTAVLRPRKLPVQPIKLSDPHCLHSLWRINFLVCIWITVRNLFRNYKKQIYYKCSD